MKLGVLVSGNLGYVLLRHLKNRHDIGFVLTDKNSDEIIAFAKSEHLPVYAGNPRNGATSEFVKDKKIDVLISINYLFIIEKDLIELPEILAFNVHGSLLPKYRGRTPHVWAIINNEKITGITAHLIDEGCDTGDILEQISVPISEDDSGNSILMKFSELYIPLIDSVLLKIKNKSLTRTPQNNEIATYFGKRTPDDGEINWNWHKERIRNWVRAQMKPYPGAFTFYNNEKIIIDEITYADFGFSEDQVNGTILSINPLVVKTPNGAVSINSFRNPPPPFRVNDILNSAYAN